MWVSLVGVWVAKQWNVCVYAAVFTGVSQFSLEPDGCNKAVTAGTPTMTGGRDFDRNQQWLLLLWNLLTDMCEEEHFFTSTIVSKTF